MCILSFPKYYSSCERSAIFAGSRGNDIVKFLSIMPILSYNNYRIIWPSIGILISHHTIYFSLIEIWVRFSITMPDYLVIIAIARSICLAVISYYSHTLTSAHTHIPPPQPYSLLTLANSTCFKDTLTDIQLRFNKLYKRKAHLHHYSRVDGMEMDLFRESSESLRSLITEYETLQATMGQPQRDTPRLTIC